MRGLVCWFSWAQVSVLGLLLAVWGVGRVACGQVSDDTTRGDAQRDTRVAPPAPLDSVRTEDVASPDTSAPEKAIVTADSLSALVRDGERLQELFHDVKVRQDTTRLRSNYGLRYLNRDELLFTGDVVIYERGDTLRADTVWYNKRTKVGRARSNVRLTDGKVLVRAPKAIYYTEEKRSVFPDSVTLVDSSRVLRAQQGTYWSNVRRAAFSGNVRLTDPNTYLEADSLTYFRDTERSIATGSVFIRRVRTEDGGKADTTSMVADTAGSDPVATDAPVSDTTAGDATTVDTTAVDTAIADTTATDTTTTDTTAITYLFGEWADNQEQNRYSRVERQALLVRVRMDSTGAPDDTLAVRAHRLEAKRTDTYRRLVAVDSVRIWQADLAAVADSVVYDRIIGVDTTDTTATPAPLPEKATDPLADTTTTYDSRLDSLVAHADLVGTRPPDSSVAPAPKAPPLPTGSDSMKLAPSPDTMRTAAVPDTAGPRLGQSRPSRRRSTPDSLSARDTSRTSGPPPQSQWKKPSVQSEGNLPLEETRLYRGPITWFEQAQVWGDSIRVRARNRSLDTVYVRGSAFAAQEDTTVDRIRQLKGKNITAFFQRDSLRQIRARPNGQAIYFSASETGKLNGATRASADYAALYFRGKAVERIKFGRGVQGKAYHKKKFIPDPFRLEGFQWTPERRPTRASLLGRKRVRERLDLKPMDRAPNGKPPPVARPPEGRRASADSVAQRLRKQRGENGMGQTTPRPQAGQGGRRERSAPRLDSLSIPVDSLRRAPLRRVPTISSDTTESPNSNP